MKSSSIPALRVSAKKASGRYVPASRVLAKLRRRLAAARRRAGG